jgi:hypothetical protein
MPNEWPKLHLKDTFSCPTADLPRRIGDPSFLYYRPLDGSPTAVPSMRLPTPVVSCRPKKKPCETRTTPPLRLAFPDLYNITRMPHLLQLAAAATVEAAGLVLVSRLLFLAGFTLMGNPPASRGRLLWHLFRLPGNLIHELSHALVLCIVGYRVVCVRLSILDKHGRGEVLAQGRWHRLIPAILGWPAASIAPIVGGIAAIVVLTRVLGVPLPQSPYQATTLGEELVARWAAVLRNVNLASWQGWLFVLLVLSIGAELAPSDRDLRAGLPSLLIVGSVLCLLAAVCYLALPDAVARQWCGTYARNFLRRVMLAEEMVLAVCGAVAVLVVLPLLVREAVGQGQVVPSTRRRVARAHSSRTTSRPSSRARPKR